MIFTGDMLQITMTPPAVVPTAIAPLPLVGKGPTFLGTSKPVCLLGDETPPPLLAPQPYMAPPFVIPGTGTFKIILLPNNLTMMSMFCGKPALLKGAVFQAMFQVMSPAQMPAPPAPPIPDPVPVKMGMCQFITTNLMIMAS